MMSDSCCCLWRGVLVSALFAVALILLAGCSSTPDPRDGPSQDVSNLPWNRQESWEGNPYGTFFQGSR